MAKCLRKDPIERYESTQDLVADFEQLESELPQLRQRGSDRGGNRPAAAHSAPWWWAVHQLTVSSIYVLMIYPAWYVQRWLRQPWGMLFLLAVLASAAAATSLRLHLRFIARYSPSELPLQLSQSRKWTRAADAVFVAAQVLGALSVGTAHLAVRDVVNGRGNCDARRGADHRTDYRKSGVQ